ncbi:MAG: AIR synthase-related protein, partial [Candidatus Cloacimonadia bacterium]
DMGAAGLTCSSSEMAAKAGTGMDIDLALVPQREKDMTPYEIMLSESQERMLLVVTPENFGKVEKIFQKWDLHVVKIGMVTNDKILRIRNKGEIVAEIPAAELVLGGGAPVYTRETKYPEYLDYLHSYPITSIPEPENYNEILAKLLTSPNIASKNYVYHQYDYMVQINTLVEPGSDAAVCRIKDTKKAIAIATDCNACFCYLDPYEGAKAAVAEAARNIVCAGGKPLAITNCLNFGNPYNPEVYWTFSEVIRGMSDACRGLDTPVTGGNVSFYNETEKSAVYPTPVIGMLGLIEDMKYATTQFFQNLGDFIVLLGEPCNEVGGSEYLKLSAGKVAGIAPKLDLAHELNVQNACKQAIRTGIVNSAHDCSEGGLAVGIAECCFNPNSLLGADIRFELHHRADFELFGESHSRIILSIPPEHLAQLQKIAQENNVTCTLLGTVVKKWFTINNLIKVPVERLYELWYHSIERIIRG